MRQPPFVCENAQNLARSTVLLVASIIRTHNPIRPKGSSMTVFHSVGRIFAVCLLVVGVRHAQAGELLDRGPQLQSLVSSALEEFAVPGAGVGIWTSHEHWVRTFGEANVASERPVLLRDHFGIRSITKSFVVTLVMQLVAQNANAIGLDDPIARYVPDIPNGDQITLRQLANMTSGLYNYTRSPGFAQAVGANPTRSWTTDELLDFAFHETSHPPIDFQPGARFEYSNTNTLVLGKFIEAVTKQRFEDVLSDEILTPLRLKSTAYLTGTQLPRPAVSGYQGFTSEGTPDEVVVSLSGLGFAGAMASTLSDLVHWGRALAGGTLLPPDLQSQRFQSRPASEDPASPVYDAYGMGIGTVGGWWGHTGEGVGFEAAVFHQIDRHETFAILLNASNVSDVPVKIFCRVLRALDQLPRDEGVCGVENHGRGDEQAPPDSVALE
jgi:D-alanyl-D-alanine carboxypeptidase